MYYISTNLVKISVQISFFFSVFKRHTKQLKNKIKEASNGGNRLIFPALRRLRWENLKLEASLDYKAIPCLQRI